MNIHKLYNFVWKLSGFRNQRARLFIDIFRPTQKTTILDLGGSSYFWKLISNMNHMDFPLNITILNLRIPDDLKKNNEYNFILADAQKLPFKEKCFDIVFCNSLIDHLHMYENQKRLADEIRRVSKAYFVQTGNQYFFYEPHYLTPFIHWLPKSFQKKIIKNFTVWGLLTRPPQKLIDSNVEEIIFSTEKEFTSLFPESEIIKETFIGLTKSFIAIKRD